MLPWISSSSSKNDWVDTQKTKNADKLADILADSWVGMGWERQLARVRVSSFMAGASAVSTTISAGSIALVVVRADLGDRSGLVLFRWHRGRVQF
jgi:hypothetical protein